ncbi:unnamed protein product [Caenorhabditis auriculariae]|uniref:Phlebovirus glycoprotein G2 fusion domain-containing protein n=1 Tax=Caenorhabditis auriculariae TaxID=2777116 RepID=A0A8S1HBP4_9PELO|nr:unnamed protein product [Caenorhabditis auriculariae]
MFLFFITLVAIFVKCEECGSRIGICPFVTNFTKTAVIQRNADPVNSSLCDATNMTLWTNCLFSEYSCFQVQVKDERIFGCIPDQELVPVVLKYKNQWGNTSAIAVIRQNFVKFSRSCSSINTCADSTVHLASGASIVARVCCCKGASCSDITKLDWSTQNLKRTSKKEVEAEAFKFELTPLQYWTLSTSYATVSFILLLFVALKQYGKIQTRLVMAYHVDCSPDTESSMSSIQK